MTVPEAAAPAKCPVYPSVAWLTLNRGCNLRCSHCYAGSVARGGGRDMDRALASGLLRLVGDMGVGSVVLTGGEPTLYEELPEVVAEAVAQGLAVGFPTNGIRLADPLLARRVAEAGVGEVNVSMKGADAKEYRRTAGADSFNLALRAIEALAGLGVPVVSSIVVGPGDCAGLPGLARRVVRAGARALQVSLLFEEPGVPTRPSARTGMPRWRRSSRASTTSSTSRRGAGSCSS